jgi:hypothetical protein
MSKNALVVVVLVILSAALIVVGARQLAPAAGGAQQAAAGPTPSIADVRRISVGDLHAKLQRPNPPLVWDLRAADIYAQQHIPGARLVPLTDVPTLAKNLDRNQAIVTLCS